MVIVGLLAWLRGGSLTFERRRALVCGCWMTVTCQASGEPAGGNKNSGHGGTILKTKSSPPAPFCACGGGSDKPHKGRSRTPNPAAGYGKLPVAAFEVGWGFRHAYSSSGGGGVRGCLFFC